jgi:hypothetical protein
LTVGDLSNDVRLDDDPDRLFLLVVFSHTGPIRGDLGDAPDILLILGGPDVALVNGLRPRIAHMILALLGEARRRKGDNGEPQNKCSETFVDSDHNEFPSLIAKPSPSTCDRQRHQTNEFNCHLNAIFMVSSTGCLTTLNVPAGLTSGLPKLRTCSSYISGLGVPAVQPGLKRANQRVVLSDSGIIIRFQFGTNWSRFTDATADALPHDTMRLSSSDMF